MRKFFKYLMSAFVLMGAVACNPQNEEPQPETKVEIRASFEDYTATRMTLEGYKPVWEAGDAITVNGVVFTTTEAGEQASFVTSETFNAENGAELFATYGDMTIATEQTAREMNMPAGTPAYAYGVYSEQTTLSFKNPAALLKFTTEVAGDITFTAIGGEHLAGALTVEGEVVTAAGEAHVTLKGCQSGKTYYVAVAPALLSDGMEVTCAGETLQAGAIGQEILSSKIYDLGTLEEITPEPDPTPDPEPDPDPTPDPEPEPEPTPETKTVYLVPGQWASDNAWFASYTWANGIDAQWAKMTDADGDGIYECEVALAMTNIIFCRMDPAKTALDWNSKWNQTVDLTIGEVPTNYFYFTDWGNEQTGGNSIGEWHEAGYVFEQPDVPSIVWALAGDFNNWGDTAMTATATANLYVAKGIELKVGNEIKVKDSTTWDTSYGGGITNLEANKWMKAYFNGSNIAIAKSGTYDVYFEYAANAEYSKIYLVEANGDYAAATEQTENGTLALPKTTTRTEEYSEGVWQW